MDDRSVLLRHVRQHQQLCRTRRKELGRRAHLVCQRARDRRLLLPCVVRRCTSFLPTGPGVRLLDRARFSGHTLRIQPPSQDCCGHYLRGRCTLPGRGLQRVGTGPAAVPGVGLQGCSRCRLLCRDNLHPGGRFSLCCSDGRSPGPVDGRRCGCDFCCRPLQGGVGSERFWIR